MCNERIKKIRHALILSFEHFCVGYAARCVVTWVRCNSERACTSGYCEFVSIILVQRFSVGDVVMLKDTESAMQNSMGHLAQITDAVLFKWFFRI